MMPWEHSPQTEPPSVGLRLWCGLRIGAPPILVVLFLGGFLYFELLHGLREVFAYRATEGAVTAYRPPDPGASRPADRHGQIRYTYSVDGRRYDGQYPPKREFSAPRLSFPLLAHEIETGRRIQVWYDGADPAQATLEPRIEPYPVFMAIFLSIGAWVGVGAFAAGWRTARLPRRRWGWSGSGKIPWATSTEFVVYAVLATIGSCGGLFLSYSLPWQTALAVGLALGLAVVPALTWVVSRWVRSRPRAEGATRTRRRQLHRSERRGFVKLLAGCLLWWAITGPFLYMSYGAALRHLWASCTYKSTVGLVVESTSVESRGRRGTRNWRPYVRYRYTVDGRQFTGDRYGFGEIPWIRRDWSDRVVAQFPPERPATVYYAPDDPASAILALQPYIGTQILMFFMVPFVGVGVFLIVATVRAGRPATRSGSSPPAPSHPFLSALVGFFLVVWMALFIVVVVLRETIDGAGLLRLGLGGTALSILLSALWRALQRPRTPADAQSGHRPDQKSVPPSGPSLP